MKTLAPIKLKSDDIDLEFTASFSISVEDASNQNQEEILRSIQDIDNEIEKCEAYVEKLNSKIDNLTNHADKLDYTIAVASGVLCGLVDTVFVGKLDLAECRDIGQNDIEKLVKKLSNEDDLKKAIKKLEERTKNSFASDTNLADFGGGRQHHLRDFAHHPTLVGLAFSILTQFTENCYGTNTSGQFIIVPVKDKARIGNTIPKKLAFATIEWFFHLVSDMAGSSSTAGAGTGLPGPLLSLAKELSVLPPFSLIKLKNGSEDISISQLISKIFNGTLFADRDSSGKIIKESVVGLDMRTGIGMVKKQMMPVILNEVIVRSFYSIRRLVSELKENKIHKLSDLLNLNWRKISPFGNRTVERMITIASGTFMAFDMTSATIQSAAKSGGNAVGFLKNFILSVNFVGIGRFAIAVVTDIKMGQKKDRLENERILLYNELLNLSNAKLYYIESNLWINIESMNKIEEKMWQTCADTSKAIIRTYSTILQSVNYYVDSWNDITSSFERMKDLIEEAGSKNPWLTDELFRNNSLKIDMLEE